MRDDSTAVIGDAAPDGTPARGAGRWRLFDLPVDRVDMDAAVQRITLMIERGRRGCADGATTVPQWQLPATMRIVTLNPEMVMAARHDPTLRESIQRAALVTADGVGVVWAARLLGGGWLARVTGVDLVGR
ncbi:MAG: WecB/TagA/CpsF family glycosyltransferase, partial [Ktedonobacterales bacterium]